MIAFALELIHPGHGTRRVEFVTPKRLALLTDGKTTLHRVGGRGSSPEALYFQWWPIGRTPQPVREVSFHVAAARGHLSPAPPRLANLNGEQLTRGTLKHGDVLRWRDFRISVFEIRPLREPELAMVDAARTDDAALQVYADWLETRGATQSAEWARLAVSALGEPEKARMNALAPRLGGSFRALVARGPVERCNQACDQRWEALPLREEPCSRSCSKCALSVTWCEDAESARSVQGPVTLDPATPRTPGDLLPRPIVVG